MVLLFRTDDLTEINPITGESTRLDEAAGVTGDAPQMNYGILSMGFASTDDDLFVFGGEVGSGSSTTNAFYQFSLDNRIWTQLNSTTNVTGTPPSPRSNVICVVLDGSLIVLGGWGPGWISNGRAFRHNINT